MPDFCEAQTRIISTMPQVDFKLEILRLNKSSLQDPSTIKSLLKDEQVIVVRKTLETALKLNLDFIRVHSINYFFNQRYWQEVNDSSITELLYQASIKMGLKQVTTDHFRYRQALLNQFIAKTERSKPISSGAINFSNGALDLNTGLRNFKKDDFLYGQLGFEYDPDASCPLFRSTLDRILPELDKQYVLAEFFGYAFTKDIKLEKVLFMVGGGANGKSLIYEIISKVFGYQNISNYNLEDLTDSKGYHRALIGDVLLNFSTEIGNNFNNAIFKQLASGEEVSARPIGKPLITIINYAKLVFIGNALPNAPESSHDFFRRFLIIAFEVTIPNKEQDKTLHQSFLQHVDRYYMKSEE